MVLLSIIFASWIIYGYTLYFSDENDCQANPDTAGWLIFMIILLIFGLLFLIMILIGMCILGCILCLMGKKGEEESERTSGILSSLPGMKLLYDPKKFTSIDTCTICLEKFESEQDKELTQLKCNEMHVFHTECIAENIKNGNTKCPLCNEEISTFDVIQMQEAMEMIIEDKKDEEMAPA
mgnify:CR=1 FL=1